MSLGTRILHQLAEQNVVNKQSCQWWTTRALEANQQISLTVERWHGCSESLDHVHQWDGAMTDDIPGTDWI